MHTQNHHPFYFGGDWALPEVAILVSEGKVFLYGLETDSEFRQRERRLPRSSRSQVCGLCSRLPAPVFTRALRFPAWRAT